MNNRIKFLSLLFILVLLAMIMFVGLGWLLSSYYYHVEQEDITLVYLAFAGIIIIASMAILWGILYNSLIKPLGILVHGAKIMAAVNPSHKLELPNFHLLGDIPEAIHGLGEALQKSKLEVAEAMAAGIAATEKQKEKLEAVLREFNEGVVVCDGQAKILLYNPAAQKLFQNSEALGLGRSLFSICTRAPIEHTWELLQHRRESKLDVSGDLAHATFVCATLKEGILLHCRMTLIPEKSKLQKSVFIITLQDVSSHKDEIGQKANKLRSGIEKLRGPLANLRAAAENLAANPGMPPEMRNAFKHVIDQESAKMTTCFDGITKGCRFLISAEWPLADIYSADLLSCLARRLHGIFNLKITMVGIPLWLSADSHSIMLILEVLSVKIAKFCKITEIDIEALLGDRRIYFDFVYNGATIPHATIKEWLLEPLPDSIGTLLVGDVLDRHGSAVWSQEHFRKGYSIFRVPMPASSRQWEEASQHLPERPEFYDFALIEERQDLGDLADRPLNSLNYVVFDTETTGLRPLEGDEIIAIAGVRVVRQRIIAGEQFERLINPRREIPASSTHIHGITEEMIRDKPPIHLVLPQFKTFVEDSVIVAHNAAFDMKFIHLKEQECGVQFNNIVLDTLILSVLLHDYTPDHTLDGIAQRLGVEVHGRHTALGDSLVTAQILVQLIDLLQAHGINTLGEAVKASEDIVKVRKELVRV